MVLGLNMAFCDVIWAKKVLDLVPYDCFDIACFHPYRVNNEKGLNIHDIYGTRRFVPVVEVRTTSLPIPLGTSPVYIVGSKGLTARVRPDPGW